MLTTPGATAALESVRTALALMSVDFVGSKRIFAVYLPHLVAISVTALTDLSAWLSPPLQSVKGYKISMFLSLYRLLIGFFIKKLAQKQNRQTIYNPEPHSISLSLSSVQHACEKVLNRLRYLGFAHPSFHSCNSESVAVHPSVLSVLFI